MNNVVFISVTDITSNKMLVRADLIFKIEEIQHLNRKLRKISFTNGESEIITDTMADLIHVLREGE